ncbi:iron-sulfur cluster insertion protein ErpA [Sinimarinibacterium sp. NLF-5-8]|uniref:iron-sulfur cluster insertion protein ErpA n=1 Tax=Sinimarinibacterium sp. NLF-5-8 TaxID=2698684 RepID=UPI00137B9A29|nr:iron-sulfur cluster insertion protein ErpA [Sinimarinibacterium sp. NLF-5-8]
MNMQEMTVDESVIFSEAAARKVWELLQDEENPQQMLRVFVTGGGCSGFQYGFRFEKDAEADDTRVEREGVTLLVDPMSLQYLYGAEIDYKESVEGAQFVIRNPNADTSCGCGNSFSI